MVVKYNPSGISVFGNIDHFQLIFSGTINDYQFDVTGAIANDHNMQIHIVGTKREDL